ncbi:MAG: hypothetical protein R3C28_22025 [Pirellulaceae bacterium]
MWHQEPRTVVLDFSVANRILSFADEFSHKSVEQMIPVIASLGKRERSVRYPVCSFAGFFPPDCGSTSAAAWTNGDAAIDCCFPQPTKMRYVWIEVAATGPGGAKLAVYVDQKRLFRSRTVKGRRTIRISLGGKRITNGISLRLKSTTYVPAATPGEFDNRVLGLAIRRIVFGAKLSSYQPNAEFDRSIVSLVRKNVRKLGRRKAA